MSTKYRWMPDLISIELMDIDYFIFGSNYKNRLSEIGRRFDVFDCPKIRGVLNCTTKSGY